MTARGWVLVTLWACVDAPRTFTFEVWDPDGSCWSQRTEPRSGPDYTALARVMRRCEDVVYGAYRTIDGTCERWLGCQVEPTFTDPRFDIDPSEPLSTGEVCRELVSEPFCPVLPG